MRIAIGGISFEAMTRSPIPTGRSAVQIYRERELLERDLSLIRGMVERLRQDTGVEIVPLYSGSCP
jgi:hypothetical protein